MSHKPALIILVAPNVSEQMGGEGIKALQIFLELRKLGTRVIQITHARNRHEIQRTLRLEDVEYVEDTLLMRFLWWSVVLRILANPLFSRQAVRLAESIAARSGLAPAEVVIHQTEPNSPVTWRATSRRHANVFGPINGNIYYPAAFRAHESLPARLRRVLHFPAQFCNRLFVPGGMKRAELIFSAGGDRTMRSLLAAGCRTDQITETLDCGVPESLLQRPRIQHQGENKTFVHFGRLVFHKGTALIIESIAHSECGIKLDIIGRGPELERCKQLSRELGTADRVRFLDWFPTHADLIAALGKYRGLVIPSMEDANGIVVQEAMALGLPVIALDWGGPQLLVEHERTGYLVPPDSKPFIVERMAGHMEQLASDGELAERFSLAGRQRAEQWSWPAVAREWSDAYDHCVKKVPASG